MQYKKIAKREAYKRWEEGLPIYLCPCKMRPDNLWAPAMRFIREDATLFEDLVNAFEYYNCDIDTGRYTTFYITDRDPVDVFNHRIYVK